jgi:preprotein translocase subunit SecF
MAAKKSSGTAESGAVEAPALETSGAQKHGFFVRLYTGTGAFEVIRKRKLWYTVSGLIVAVALASIVLRGFTFGIDFEGGTKVSLPAAGANGTVSVQQVEDVFSSTLGRPAESVVAVGSGDSATLQIRSETLSNDETEKLRTALFDAFQPKGPNGQPSKQAISDSAVSETWGGQITQKALIALVVFLVAVVLFLAVRFQPKMAIAAIVALLHDLLVTAGIYSIVGFEVTPSTVVGLLTILGFSLYDTVVVYDKVAENSRDLLAGSRMTYSDAANLAVNQTLMRSINTSLIALLPVAGLLFVGVGLLGVGTIKDLALVLFVGLASGAYSSLFLATPIVVELTEREPAYKALAKRVEAKRSSEAARAAAAASAEPAMAGVEKQAPRRTGGPAPAPRPGARPQRQRRR